MLKKGISWNVFCFAGLWPKSVRSLIFINVINIYEISMGTEASCMNA